MNQIVPPKFLFRWSFVALKIDELPRHSGRLLDLPEECSLPSLGTLDHRPDFARVKMAWNSDGIGVSIEVTGRSTEPFKPREESVAPDSISLWFDTRNTQTVHRATKYCHHLMLLPFGAGSRRTAPVVLAFPVARARDENLLPNAELVKIAAGTSITGYWVDAWFPAEVLAGYDPAAQNRIGLQYAIYDTELGKQTLAVGDEFPYESDPGLWQTVELTG